MRPVPPPGAVIAVIESDECCSSAPCTGRLWDESMQKPSFVAMSAGEWSTFTATMGMHIRHYRKEGWGFGFLAFGIAIGMLFHPSIGPIGRQISSDRRRLYTSSTVDVEADSGTPDKDGTYLAWGDYMHACEAGCKYADTLIANASVGSCAQHGQVRVEASRTRSLALCPCLPPHAVGAGR